MVRASINFLSGAACVRARVRVVCAQLSAVIYNSSIEKYSIRHASLTDCDGNGTFSATGRLKLVRKLSLAVTTGHLEHVTCWENGGL